MRRLPTRIAEQVYQLLVELAKADSVFYEREVFVFHFSIIDDSSESYVLECRDGERRVFYCTGEKKMWVEGKGCIKINAELKKISDAICTQFSYKEFVIIKNAI